MNGIPPKKPVPADFFVSPSVIPSRPLQQETLDLEEDALWEAMETGEYAGGILENYLTDLCYVETVDSRVFRYLLPFLLEAWTAALEGKPAAHRAAGEFHAAMARKSETLRAVMGPETEAGCIEYLVAVLHWQVARQGSLEHPDLTWLPHWVGAACGLPDLAEAWFRMMEGSQTIPLASCYLLYLSRFAYRPFENPLFLESDGIPEPWTRAIYLTGGISWQPESLKAAGEHLSIHRIRPNLERIISGFQDDLLVVIARDVLARLPHIESRAPEAIRNLGLSDPPSYWSDAFG